MVLLESRRFSDIFLVRPLTKDDVEAVLRLYQTNPYYFEQCPPKPTASSVLGDMTKLPPGKTLEDKHFVGYFDADKMVAVLDLVESYPDEDTVFIGLFILDKCYQGKGLGSRLIEKLLDEVTKSFNKVKLGYIATNEPAVAFWQKQGFVPTGVVSQEEQYSIILAEYLKDKG